MAHSSLSVPRPRKLPIRIQFACQFPECNFAAYRHSIMDEHSELRHRCPHCGSSFLDVSLHIFTCPQRGGGRSRAALEPDTVPADLAVWPFVESARFHLGTLLIYEYTPEEVICLVAELFESVWEPIARLLIALVRHFGGIRVSFRVVADLIEEGQNFRVANRPIGSSWAILSHIQFVEEVILNSATYIILALNYFNEGASNFAVERLTRLDIHVGEYAPLSPRGDIPLPECLKGKRGLLNITGTNGHCFHYCILAHIYGDQMSDCMMVLTTTPKNSVQKVACFQRRKRIMARANNYDSYFEDSGIDFSMISITANKGCSIHDIAMFELQNDISVSVFGHVGSRIVPRRLTLEAKQVHVNLLIIENDKGSHFVLIQDLSGCIGSIRGPRHVYCPQCLRAYVQQHALDRHIVVCGKEEVGGILLPTEDTFRFMRYEMTRKQDYCMYYCIQEQYIRAQGKDGTDTSHPIPIGYSIVLFGPNGNVERVECKVGFDLMGEFVTKSIEIAEYVTEKLRTTNNFIPLTKVQAKSHELATICEACLKPFTIYDPKALDHCHTSGLYQGAKHVSCNLRIRMPRHLSAVTFNTSKTSFRSIIAVLDSVPDVYRVEPIMKAKSAMAGLIVNGILRFVDVTNYRPNERFSDLVREVMSYGIGPVVSRMGPHMFDMNLFQLEEHIAPDPVFDSSLGIEGKLNAKGILQQNELVDCETAEPATDAQYRLYLKYWYGGHDTIRKYLESALQHKVVLIAEVMERFRFLGFEKYGLDPLYSWTIASYTFQCAFYFNRLELGVVTCPNVANMIDGLVRGGYQVMTQKNVKSNTKAYGDYDPNEPESRLLYSDIIQSYSNCMKSYLPDGNFRMMTRDALEAFDFINPELDTGMGYCFQVSLKLDESLHSFFSDMPLSPEHYDVQYDVSATQGSSYTSTSRKRYLATLLPKTEKTYYYKTLSFLLQKGYELTAVHQGFQFTESKFLEPYVDYNTGLRYESDKDMDRRLYKSMLNFLSGKLLVNQLSYPNTTFCFSSIRARQLLGQDNFQDVIPFDENISLFKMKKTRAVDLNFRGTASVILELGRLELYKLYYDGFRRAFGRNVRLIFSNTDSLLCKIQCNESVYLEKMKSMTDIFDYSNLPRDSPLYDESNKNVPGKLKIAHHDIIEFLGLGVTTYSILTQADQDGESTIRCSGMSRLAVQKFIRHCHFREAVEHQTPREVELDTTRVIDHNTFRVKVSRSALKNADMSRVFLSSNVSLPYGHRLLSVEHKQLNSNTYMTKYE